MAAVKTHQEVFVSVIIPVYNGAETIKACLQALFQSDYHPFEVIVIDDNSTDPSAQVAGAFPCQVIRLRENAGAAAARNRGAAAAQGEILFFLDADILIEPSTISQIVETFRRQPEISALFCSYQKETLPANFCSVYKNLLHHYTHQISKETAATFCSGFGAMKRAVFFQFAGFDEAYRSLEDIEFGYRLYQAGHKIYLQKRIQLTHCKQYTLLGLLKSDVLNRAIPWTRIMLQKQIFRNDLNTKGSNILSVPVAFLLLLNLPLALVWPGLSYSLVGLLGILLVLNQDFYRFVYQEKGGIFTVQTVLMSWFNYLYSGLGLVLGLAAFVKERPWRFSPIKLGLNPLLTSGGRTEMLRIDQDRC